MSVDELVEQLASLNLRVDRSSHKGSSKKLGYSERGEHAVKQLEGHLAKVRLAVAPGAVSPKTLGDAARQEGKGLFKIAQAGLRNTAGGLEPLRLAYEASRTLLPLSPFITAADLTMEKLWYKVASRSVELGAFALGLRASARLQMCLNQRKGEGLTKVVRGGPDRSLLVASDGEERDLRLRSFALPGATASMPLAKLVSGASLNACRCCLEIGSRESLRLMIEELSVGAGTWIDRVSDLGDGATADSYRGLLFKQLWLGCATLEKNGRAVKSSECLSGRKMALRVLLRKEASWSVDTFVAHALRAAVALQERLGNDDSDAGAKDAADLSAFCLGSLCTREGEGWPAPAEGGAEAVREFHSSWVEWLQYSAGVHQKIGQAAEAQRLLRLAYDYVQRCRKLQSTASKDCYKSAECAAYAGILKMHTASMITSLHPPGDAASIAASPKHGVERGTNRRVGKGTTESPDPALAVSVLTRRGLDYVGDVLIALGSVPDSTNTAGTVTGAELAVFVGAAVKVWTRAKKSCAVIALWQEEGVGELEESEWLALNVRGRSVLAELSLSLARIRERSELGSFLERIPSAASLYQLAIDSYLRVAHASLGAIGSATSVDDAHQALAAAAQVLGMVGDAVPSQGVKRVGTGFFGLGTSLLDQGKVNAGVDALVQGCRLIEEWVHVESDRSGTADDDVDLSATDISEILRSSQLDMRLVRLSLALQDSATCAVAAAAAARALAFCPGIRCFRSEDRLQYHSGAVAMVERIVACMLGYGGSACPNAASTAEGLTRSTIKVLSAYLSDGEVLGASASANFGVSDLVRDLEKRGLPPGAIVWALFEACRVYRAYLPRCVSQEAGSGSQQGEEEGGLFACVEGHRLATQAVLGICRRLPRDHQREGIEGQVQAERWEAHAWLLGAKFELDLHTAGSLGTRRGVDIATVVNLSAGIEHAASGAAAVPRLDVEGNKPDSRAAAAAAGGVFACVRAMLLRAISDHDDDVKIGMCRSLDLLLHATRGLDWAPGRQSPQNGGPFGIGSIVESLDVLEVHYTLHSDAWRRVKVSEVRHELAGRVRSSEVGQSRVSRGATGAGARDCVSEAVLQIGSLCGLGFVSSAAASAEMCQRAAPERRGLDTAAGRETNSTAFSDGLAEAVRAAVDVVRGVCLAEQSGGRDGESVLLEVRGAVSHPGSSAIAPMTAAYLECVAGLGLSWLYQRRGRLVEAITEVRQVMRLCRTWASAGGPLAGSDNQVVALSAAKGDCIHDEAVPTLAGVPIQQAQVEEGVGEEGGDVDDTMHSHGMDEHERERTKCVLESRWIPVYLESLTRMGCLWRERGVAWKASLTLRQGCIMSESLHAARFLRESLLEEVKVATGKHLFARADRLLGASRDLLHQERRELKSSAGADDAPAVCAACHALVEDPVSIVGASGPTSAPTAVEGAPKRGSKKTRGKRNGKSSVATTKAPTVACIRCRELDVSAAELAVAEASLLRKQGDFAGALATCERGQEILAPLMEANGEKVSSPGGGSVYGPYEEAEEQRHRRRTAEVLAMLRLQQGRVCSLLGNSRAGEALFRDCSDDDSAPALLRAAALYRVGRMALSAGEAARAKLSLELAEALIRGAGVPKLVRNIRRVLAVALVELAGQRGASAIGVDGSWRVAALSSLSVGLTHCNQVSHASAKRNSRGDFKSTLAGVPAGLRLFDVVSGANTNDCVKQKGSDDVCGESCLEDAVGSDLVAEWPVVSLCLVPGEGECKRLLVTRLVRGRPPLTLSVPLSPGDTHLLERWRGIMEENRETLRGHSAEEAAEFGNQQKARWWECRVAVDDMVGDFLHELEERWFEVHGLVAVLLGDVVGERLGLELEGIFEFAKDRIRAAHRDASLAEGVNGCMKAKGKKRSRKPASGGGSRVGAAVKSIDFEQEQYSYLSELIRACVRGGEAMSERAWFAVVRLALSEEAVRDAVATEISREIHEKVRAVFTADQDSPGRVAHGQPFRPATADPRLSPDIEKGRSSNSVERGKVVRAAVSRKSRAVATTCETASIDAEAMTKMKVADLRRELSARGVSIAGLKLKADLLAKLVETVREEAGRGTANECRVDDDDDDDIEQKEPDYRSPVGKSKRQGHGSVTSESSLFDEVSVATSKAKGRAKRSPHVGGGGGTSDDADGIDGGFVGVGGSRSSGGEGQRHPVVLVLDEQLQAIPWEGLPCLRGHAVTRVPAVPFVFAALAAQWDGGADGGEGSPGRSSPGGGGEEQLKSPTKHPEEPWIPSRDGVRLDRGYYVLDPEANLPHTRRTLGPVFREIRRRWRWSGEEGESATEEAMTQTLEEVDIFAYCGHGAGELMVGREVVAGLTKCPVAVLMGCSSGRLKGYGDFEPMGMATSYLMGGSPAVVANLWDVTDKDIDRFSVALFEAFLGNGGDGEDGNRKRALTLAHAVAESRSKCKMPFVIGYAPVCYGIPVAVATSPLAR